MITPILLNRLKWKGYLIFMVTNFLFVPLVYFCYPETANLTLEEIDYIFAEPDKGAVKWSLEMRKQRVKYGHRESMVGISSSRRASRAGSTASGARGERKVGSGQEVQYAEKI